MKACWRCGCRLEGGDLRCPVCGLALEAPRTPGEALEKVQARVVRCGTCGASLEYSAEVKAPRCAFCASVMQVEVMADPLEQAEAFVPFEVEAGAAREALGEFLGRGGFFRPGDLERASSLESLQPLWWPAWAFNGEARVSWAADSDADSGRSDWAPHAGQVELAFSDVVVSASRGLTQAECARLGPHYTLGRAEGAPRGPEEARVELFDVTRSGARARIGEAVEEQARERVTREQVPGRRKRNVHVAVALARLETRRYALPAWVLAYRYRGSLYRVVVHGQDVDVVLGKMPLSVVRVALAVGAGLLVLALLARMFLR